MYLKGMTPEESSLLLWRFLSVWEDMGPLACK